MMVDPRKKHRSNKCKFKAREEAKKNGRAAGVTYCTKFTVTKNEEIVFSNQHHVVVYVQLNRVEQAWKRFEKSV
jgi:hypothetical protein